MKTIASAEKKVNRRLSPRRRARGRVECRLGASGQGSNCAAALEDISEAGAGLLLTKAIEPGRRVELRFRGWGHDSPITIVAKVVWCTAAGEGQFRVGVQFEQYLSYEDFQLLT
jgi:c-di-GMP-binding flagellar brake protein YcgR